jgi:hypothetical protein
MLYLWEGKRRNVKFSRSNKKNSVSVFNLVISVLLHARTRMGDAKENDSTVAGANVQSEYISIEIEPSTSSLWRSSKRPTQQDHQATLTLLALRRELDNEFTNKKNVKLDLWMRVANKLNELGFFVGHGVEGRDRCKTKFHNLQSMYMKTVDLRKRTGQGKIKLPPYFEELDAIFHDKHKANPVFSIDSTTLNQHPISSTSTTTSSSHTDLGDVSDSGTTRSAAPSPIALLSNTAFSPHPETSDDTQGRFKNIKKSVKPTSKQELLQELLHIQKTTQAQRQAEFQTIIELMNKQSEQRHQQIMALLGAQDKKRPKKRRHESSSSD